MTRIRPLPGQAWSRLPVLAGYAVPFVLALYLALESGGYDLITRSQAGIVVWWAILLGVATGLLPVIRVTRPGWVVLALLGGLVLWTALGALTWTQSTERSALELSRSITLIGILFLLMLAQGREGLRKSLGALGAATAVVAVVALASRYQPGWFDLPEFPENYPKARLNHPLGYWNGLATLMAMGLPLLLWSAAFARSVLGRSLATAAIPLLVLVTYLTASRGGAIEVAVALVALFLITPGRITLFLRTVVPAVLSIILIWLITRRPELRDNLGGPADAQGTEMIWLTIAIFVAGVAVAGLAESRVFPRWKLAAVSRSAMKKVGIGLAAIVAIGLIAGLASGTIGDRWNEFKQPVDHRSTTVERLNSVSSGERYDQWRSAIEAGKTEVLTGLGPGAYEYWWSRNGTGPGFVRDAHSFYLEGFAETGIPGLMLTLALVLFPIGLGARRAVCDVNNGRRPALAAATAAMATFAVAAGIDWAWELTVLPVAFLVLVAAICGPDAEVRTGRMHRRNLRLPFLPPARIGIVALSVIAAVIIAVPMIGAERVNESQELFREGDLSGSIEKARSAHNLVPWSANASIQLALLGIEAGDKETAVNAATDATDSDPYNWKAWYVLSRAANFAGDSELSDAAYEEVMTLNRELRSVR